MNIDPKMTLKQARDLFYAINNFPKDGGISKTWWSPIACRDLKVYLPNFKWRKKALPFHDLHHIITGYEFQPTGEFQISAWEFAAGRYRNIFTTLFCIPLVSIGAIVIPKLTLLAFCRGKRSKTLYYYGMSYEKILDRTIEDVRKEFLPNDPIDYTFRDIIDFCKLVTCSLVVLLTPLILCYLLIIGLI